MGNCAHTLLALLALIGSAGEDRPLAPDGRPGLGAEGGTADLLSLFRQPTDEEEAFLTELGGLPLRIEVLARTTEALYRARGNFALLDPREDQTLERLHDAYREHSRDVGATLARGDEVARTFARLLLDTRFRVRMELLEDWELDAEELRDGLAVLRGVTDGWVRPTEEQVHDIAVRVDLAAALLRARHKDLEALRESPDSEADVDPARVTTLLAPADEDDPGARQGFLIQVVWTEAERADRMASLLFTTRLWDAADRTITWRRIRRDVAKAALSEVLSLRPDTEEGRDAPPDVQRMTKTRRRRAAYEKALKGMDSDPLNDELAYAAALLSRYVGGTLEALSHYDRFLALRGIRSHDDRTFRRRRLDEKEQDALFFVQHTERTTSGLADASAPADSE